MITKFKIFEKLEIDEKTIRVDGGERGWYIDFYFDVNSKGHGHSHKLIGVDNKWHINIPDWIGLDVNILNIASWTKKYDPKINVSSQVYHIIKHDAQKYNL